MAVCSSVALAQEPATPDPAQRSADVTAPPEPALSKFRSPEDGWPDISQFLDARYGSLPVGSLITEPAVGFGAAGGLAFIKQAQGVMRLT